jgi:DNA-directed RNA polymerase subunit RPC12/RpoP
MARIGGCSRCKNGDVLHNSDSWGDYWQCVQCGHIIEKEVSKVIERYEPRLPRRETKIPSDYRISNFPTKQEYYRKTGYRKNLGKDNYKELR